MAEWLYVIASLATEPKSAQPMTERQCMALAEKVATVRGRRVAACLSPDGAWWPTPIGLVTPPRVRLASATR